MPDPTSEQKMDHDDSEREAARDYARENSGTFGVCMALRGAFLAGCSYVRAQQPRIAGKVPTDHEIADLMMSASGHLATACRAAYGLGRRHAGSGVKLNTERPSEKPPEQLIATQAMMREEELDSLTYAQARRITLGFELSSQFRKLSDEHKKTAGDAPRPEKVAPCFDGPPEQGYYESFYPYHHIFLRVPREVLQEQLEIGDLITVNYSNWPLPTFYIGTVKFAIRALDCRGSGGAVEIKAIPVVPADELRRAAKAAIENAACSARAELRNAPKAATVDEYLAAAAALDRARQPSQNESAEFSDEEIMAMMPESLRRDLAELIKQACRTGESPKSSSLSSAASTTQATVSRFAPPIAAPGFARVILNAGIVEHCRNFLAAERAWWAAKS